MKIEPIFLALEELREENTKVVITTPRGEKLSQKFFRKEEETHNILFPPSADPGLRAAVEATVPRAERHRWFRSMKSSQAVAQSVFGNLIAGGNLGLLTGLKSDDGLPALCDNLDAVTAQLEYSVGHLGEPRPTSVDLWINGSNRIAVECKLTESEFGTCSRPRLSEARDRNYQRDHCDGSYTQQRDRQSRCSLTEIGVRYWDHIPSFFDWSRLTKLPVVQAVGIHVPKIDDSTALTSPHGLDRQERKTGCHAEVRLEDVFQRLGFHPQQIAAPVVTDVVDQHVPAFELSVEVGRDSFGLSDVDEIRHPVVRADTEFLALRNDCARGSLTGTGDNTDIVTVLGQGEGDRSSDAFGAAGD